MDVLVHALLTLTARFERLKRNPNLEDSGKQLL